MGMTYYFDGSLPQPLIADLIVAFENLFERCPSDSTLDFSLLSIGGRLCLEITLHSATMRIRESLEGHSISSIKQRLIELFQSRLASWRGSPRHPHSDSAAAY